MTKPLVLVVDDDEDIRDAVSWALEDEGYRVATATDGRDALRRLREGELPSVVLVDLMMPHMDGEELVRAVAASPFAHVPIVVMSGHVGAGAKAGAAGAAACLPKPVDLDDLLSTIARFTSRSTEEPRTTPP